jgi:hypothetical protein
VTDHEPDLELQTRLRAADPASSLPPADPDQVAQLLEEAMSETTTRAHESRETGTRDRSPLTWLVAAAAVVLIAAAGIFGMAQRDHGSSPVVQGRSVTQLGFVPPQGRCQVPNAGVLKEQTVAFRGTLVSVVDGTATFDVTHWYRGGPTDTARITATPPTLATLVQAADLAVGSDFLVAAGDGTVLACGFTGPANGNLQTLYDQAFG